MSKQLSKELQQLEQSGRISVRGHRQVHADFGFTSIKSSPQTAASKPVASGPVARDLDSAFDRLKRSVEPR